MDNLTEVRPKLKQNAIFLQTRDGVFLQSDDTVFTLKGKTIYQLLATLSPHMNGEHTVSELCEGLGPAQQETVIRLINTLLQRGVLKQCTPEALGIINEAVYQRFRAQIELIDHYADRPLERFKAFRESRILLIGAGEAFNALGTSLIRNGVRDIFLAVLDASDASLRHLEAEVEVVRQSMIECNISTVDFDPRVTKSFQDVDTYDIVVYCADTSSFQDILTIQKHCLDKECMFLPIVFLAGQSVLGPLVKPQGPCWLCAQVRLAANAEDGQDATIWKSFVLDNALVTMDTTFFTPVARHIGNAIGFELFKIFAGHLPSELAEGIICQDHETLESYQGNLIQYPLCPVCSKSDYDTWERHTLEIVAGTRGTEVLSREDLLRQVTPLIHTHTGLFSGYQDDTLTQLPLKVSRMTISSPVLSQAQQVIAFHFETVLDARVSVLREAIGRYTKSLPDIRNMLHTSRNALEQQGKKTIAAHRLSTWSGVSALAEDTRYEWLPAFSFSTQRLYYVPAAVVYSSSYLNRRSVFEKTSAGSTVYTHIKEALVTGLISALAYEHMREVLQKRIPLLKLDPEALENIDTDLTFLLRSIKHFERTYALFEVLPESPLHLMLACTNDADAEQLVGIGFGLSGIGAAQNALLQLVGKLQALKYENYAPTLKDTFFPEFTSCVDFASATASMSRFHEPAVTVQQLEDHLYQQGRDILFVNTTTADIWESGVFMSGTVLLTKPE